MKFTEALLIGLFLIFKIESASAVEIERWTCSPKHWVNMHPLNGVDINPGQEPSFTVTLIGKSLTTAGKDSWLDNGEFVIQEKIDINGSTFVKALAVYGSSFMLNQTAGEFVYTGTLASLAVSMAGKCFKGQNFTPD